MLPNDNAFTEKLQPPLCKSSVARSQAYELLHVMVVGIVPLRQRLCRTILELFDSVRIEIPFWHIQSNPSHCGYVGLENLGCTCYLNAMVQQLFSIKDLRYSLLAVQLKDSSISDAKHESAAGSSPEGEVSEGAQSTASDARVFLEFQRIFAYLSLSNRPFFKPDQFCSSFSFSDANDAFDVFEQQVLLRLRLFFPS